MILSGCSDSSSQWSITVSSESTSSWWLYQSGIDSDLKVELAKNRRKQIRLIRTWDFYMAKNNPWDALISYLEALEKLPNDHVVEKKIAEAYYASKDWKNAYAYFTRVPIDELKLEEKKNLFRALFFSHSKEERKSELQKFALTTNEKDYYMIIDTCSNGTEPCIASISSYSWSHNEIKRLANVIKNAPKISPDLAYRNFSLATEFYVLWEYSVAYTQAKDILKERWSYYDVQKLVWFSIFALGGYTESRDVLRSYIEHVPTDIEVIVRLWEISSLLKNYTEANLYLNNAIAAWYSDKINIERSLAYNYSQLWDATWMIKVLSYLLSEKDVLEDDFAVAISLAFARGENLRAYVWAIEWLKKFPNSPVLAPMYMMALRIIGRWVEVPAFVKTLTGEVLWSPLVLLELGIYDYDIWDMKSAKEKFNSVFEMDNDADFGIEAENYLKKIEEKEAEERISNGKEDIEEGESWWWF